MLNAAECKEEMFPYEFPVPCFHVCLSVCMFMCTGACVYGVMLKPKAK
jgi:hypothetical protein